MTTSLSAPNQAYGLRLVGVGTGALALAAWMTSFGAPRALPALPMGKPSVHAARTPMSIADPRANELPLVLTVGNVPYLSLATIGEDDGGIAMPAHDAAQLVADDDSTAAVAHIANVPRAYRAWLDRSVELDTGCIAKVTGFDVVSRVTGDPVYAGEDSDREGGEGQATWTTASVMAHGSQILAARIQGCSAAAVSSALYARATDLPAVIILDKLDDDQLVQSAKLALATSAVGMNAQAELASADGSGSWTTGATWDTQVLRHPLTGETWVSVHGAMSEMCGGPDINAWGLYRVDAHRALVPVEVRELGEMRTIERIIDVDGDGTLELIGRAWLADDTIVKHADGKEVSRLPLSFYGCPC
jgi:hypothetical protein